MKAPELPKGVVPEGATAPALVAMDSNSPIFPAAFFGGDFSGFPGYPHLSFLATRAEYRAMASALSTELTREWITLNSSETDGESSKQKVTELTKKLQDIGLQQVIQRAVEHDAYFGRAQILIDIKGHDLTTPLILSSKTIAKDSFNKVTTVEAIWTTPASYNALDPAAPDFYRPAKYFMLGKEVHASRLMTIITRPLPDMLKPAFNFGGMSLSQLAEPYVDNWLRTRQSVSDLINNFSITALATSMDQVLEGADDGTDLFARAALFTATRSNKGLMLLDKDREEIIKVDTSLAGLHELQAQSQEHMCAVSKTPSTILLGVAPTGFGNVSEGEIATWEKWVSAEQEAFYRLPIQVIINVLQLSMYGSIDPNITFTFNPLSQMTPAELAAIRTADSTTAGNYIDRGVIDPSEERERLARDPESGYQGLDLSLEITDPNLEDEDDEDDEDDEPTDTGKRDAAGSGKR
jgi:phage-related protein (TIGR01555 family)